MNAPAGRVLAICVDDVGLVDGVAETVLALAAAGRVNAASCVTNAPGWRGAAATLRTVDRGVDRRVDRRVDGKLDRKLDGTVDRKVDAAADLSIDVPADRAPELGLHFNLSEGAPLSAALRRHWPRLPTLRQLLLQSHLGRVPGAAVADELRAQLDAFADALGRWPDFLDGHQHVHALPQIRTVVLEAIAAAPRAVAVRNTGRLLGPGSAFKRRVIEASGGRALQRALVARGIAHNRALLGAYDFEPTGYGAHMRGWLGVAPADGGLLFCHPCAGARGASDDPIAAARRSEAAYLAGDEFAADLAAAGITIGAAWAKRSSSAD